MESFTPELPPLKPNETAAEIRKAACLALVKKNQRKEWCVLLGKRTKSHIFMPEKYVFPGGRLDKADYALVEKKQFSGQIELNTERILKSCMPLNQALSNILAAIREAYEETGYFFIKKNSSSSFIMKKVVSQLKKETKVDFQSWIHFLLEAKALPFLDSIQVFARALTPPNPVRRFDTWYFFADLTEKQDTEKTIKTTTDELENIAFYSFKRAYKLEVPAIMRFALQVLESRLLSSQTCPPSIPFVRNRKNKMFIKYIGQKHDKK